MRLMQAVTVAILLVIIIPGITYSLENDDLLVGTLIAVGANSEVLDIIDWSIINRSFMDFTQMGQYSEIILDIFSAEKENFISTKEYNEMYRILNTKGKLDSDTFLQIIIQSVLLPEEYEKEPQTYLAVSVTSRSMTKHEELANKVRESITFFKGQSKITSCVTGSFDGKLDEVKQDNILEKISAYLKITDTEKMNDDYTFNLMGSSPLLDEGIQILGKNYNINIVMRYNSEEDKTYIWIGTPIISVEH